MMETQGFFALKVDDATWLREAPSAPDVQRDSEAKRLAFNYILREEADSTISRATWSSLIDAAVAYYTLHGHLPMNLTGNSMTGVSLSLRRERMLSLLRILILRVHSDLFTGRSRAHGPSF